MIYCYMCDCGITMQDNLPMSKATYRPECKCGKTMERDFGAEVHGGKISGWPMWSEGGGCHRDDVAEFRTALREKGVDAEMRADGAIKWESRAHKKACVLATGQFDRDAGYGDAQI